MADSEDTYSILRFGPDERRESEPMGTKTKFWFDRQGDKWLFKEGYETAGDQWSEKAAYELADLLDIQAAEVKLATLEQADGTVVQGTAAKNFVPDDGELVHGNELLAKHFASYEEDKRFNQYDHRVDRIFDILRTELGSSAVDVFVSYLVLDAWIANVDRHHENWAIIRDSTNDRIAPTYDHASSLGRLLDDDKRTRVLKGCDRLTVRKFLTRSKSGGAIYPQQSNEQVPPYRLLSDVLDLGCGSQVEDWLGAVQSTSDREVDRIFSRFPNGWISEPAVDFAKAILETTETLMEEILEAS